MAELKTKRNNASVRDFLTSVENKQRRKDALELLEIFTEVTGEKAFMWGTRIVGFGSFQYKYASGRKGDWMLTGFSPGKQNLSIYIMTGFEPYAALLSELGRYKTGASCLYIIKLEDVDKNVLREIIRHSVNRLRNKYSD